MTSRHEPDLHLILEGKQNTPQQNVPLWRVNSVKGKTTWALRRSFNLAHHCLTWFPQGPVEESHRRRPATCDMERTYPRGRTHVCLAIAGFAHLSVNCPAPRGHQALPGLAWAQDGTEASTEARMPASLISWGSHTDEIGFSPVNLP